QLVCLGIDAFSSAAIPVPLLTRQAVQIYLQHLRRPGGILAIHISNRYLDLEPVVQAAATALGLDSAVIHSKPSEDKDPEASSSTWVLLAPDRETLAVPAIADAADKTATRTVRPWTDDLSNLLTSVGVKAIFGAAPPRSPATCPLSPRRARWSSRPAGGRRESSSRGAAAGCPPPCNGRGRSTNRRTSSPPACAAPSRRHRVTGRTAA